jgi:hypothetical protein
MQRKHPAPDVGAIRSTKPDLQVAWDRLPTKDRCRPPQVLGQGPRKPRLLRREIPVDQLAVRPPLAAGKGDGRAGGEGHSLAENRRWVDTYSFHYDRMGSQPDLRLQP